MIYFIKIASCSILLTNWLIIYLITIKILMKRRIISSTILWLLVIHMIPFLGIIIYFLLNDLKLDKLRNKRSKNIYKNTIQLLSNVKNKNLEHYQLNNSTVADSLFKFCENRQKGITGVKNNSIQLISNTKNIIKKLIQDINMSKKNIEIIFYIWFPGGIADKVAISLINASKRGVHCRIILDAAGSTVFFRSSWVNKMCHAGIEIVKALKINLLYIFIRRMDLRQHKKIIIIDNYIAYTGSMNLIDPSSFKKNIGIGEWIDLMVRIKGPVVIILGTIFSCDWAIETGKYILPIIPKNKIYNFKKHDNQYIQVIASGPCCPENIIHQALLTAIYSAKKKLIITTPYFVPSENLLDAICTASYRGVEVILILPMYNDSLFVSWASRAFFDELLESGVKIYQFYGGLLHTKSLLIDDQLSMIGTLNLDIRSLSINFELTLFIDSTDFSNKLLCIQNEYIASSKLLDPNIWFNRNWKTKIFEKIFYFFSPLL